MKKSILAMLLALTMLLAVLSGCGAAPEEATNPPAETTEAPAQVPDEPAPDDEAAPPEEDPGEEAGGRVEYELPLFDEPQELTYWSIYQGMDESKGSFLFWQRLADETNVTLEFIDAPEEAAAEKYHLMIVSGDISDIIEEKGLTTDSSSSCPYTGGYNKAIEDDVYLDLTDYIKEQCPNYWSLLQENPGVYRDVALDDGTLFCFAEILDESYGPNQGAWVRTDMMKEAGINEIPTTETGWLELWKAMKSADVVEQPTRASNLGDLYPNIAEAYGTTASSNFLVDLASGEVFYDVTSDCYRDYLEFFREVYGNGLLNADFYNISQTSMQEIDGGMIATYECVLGAANMMTSNGIEMAACPAVHLSDYDVSEPKLINYEDWNSQIVSGVWCCVGATCENLDAVLRWFDFLYSDYGIQVCNYGFDEGVSYDVLDDGSLQLTPAMLDRDENMIVGRMQYTMKEGPSYMVAKIELPVSSEFVNNSYSTWHDFDKDAAIYSTIPTGVKLNDEENVAISEYMSDIETYVSTVTMQWMTLTTELTDESWDDYVAHIEAAGINEVIAAYQSAYDRYLSK